MLRGAARRLTNTGLGERCKARNTDTEGAVILTSVYNDERPGNVKSPLALIEKDIESPREEAIRAQTL